MGKFRPCTRLSRCTDHHIIGHRLRHLPRQQVTRRLHLLDRHSDCRLGMVLRLRLPEEFQGLRESRALFQRLHLQIGTQQPTRKGTANERDLAWICAGGDQTVGRNCDRLKAKRSCLQTMRLPGRHQPIPAALPSHAMVERLWIGSFTCSFAPWMSVDARSLAGGLGNLRV